MNEHLQQEFAARVTDTSFFNVRRDLEQTLGITIPYRITEMPVFVNKHLQKQLEEASIAIIKQCVEPSVYKHTHHTLLPQYTVTNENPTPLFSVVDFAVCYHEDIGYFPRLIELQGFPSLFGYQYLFAKTMIDHYHLEGSPFFSGVSNHQEYVHLLRSAIFAQANPDATALMEIDPYEQKTLSDFISMKHLIGLPIINIRDVVEKNGSLYAQMEGGLQPLQRIYNRAIIDELNDLDVPLHFEWNKQLDVQWAGHPNWYFRMSKYIMPFLRHSSVPSTTFLSELSSIPTNLSTFVLKPLYSFAGKGVVVGPKESDITAIPTNERSQWILQERVDYHPCVHTPYGNNKVEIRVMCIWPEGASEPLPVMSLARTGRGTLMGARYNTEPWTGSSGCLFVD
jgi:hypothetical protein